MMKKKTTGNERLHQRSVRVFVSSTFKDMQDERDELVKRVFPVIRHRCRLRGIDFVEIDLRWGITEEQARQGKVLGICLDEIERCRPYFIGILGERYGWIPDDIQPEIKQSYPWIGRYEGKSVTEMEIIHGVLDNPDMAEHAFFYFRHPAWINRLDPKRRADYIETASHPKKLLETLKNRIRSSGFPVKENFANPRELGNAILNDLWPRIDAQFPENQFATPFQRENAAHESFGENRTRIFTGRQHTLDALDRHVNSPGPPMVTAGDSGSGKTALLANWVKRYRGMNPDRLLIVHYIGSTAQSTDHFQMIRRLMETLKQHFRWDDPIPDENERLTGAFSLWLERADQLLKTSFIVIVIDALDRLEDRQRAPDLGWLPQNIPDGIRMVLSTSPGRSLDAIQKIRKWPYENLEPLSRSELKSMIQDYLAVYRKALSGERIDRILGVPQSKNALYLTTLLNELRVYGDHFGLDQQITHYTQSKSVADLFEKMLHRLEHDFDTDRPQLVRDTFSLIQASRNGIAESELLDILSTSGKPLPKWIWSPLFLSMEGIIFNQSGLLNFFHTDLKAAVKKRYLSTPSERHSAHRRLADYFQKQKSSPRKADELPHHLMKCEDWRGLKGCLTDPQMFQLLHPQIRGMELLSYWNQLKKFCNPGTAYRQSLVRYNETVKSPMKIAQMCSDIGAFLVQAAAYDSAGFFIEKALKIREKYGKKQFDPERAQDLNLMATLLMIKTRYTAALSLCEQALTIHRSVYGKHHLETVRSMKTLAVVVFGTGDVTRAKRLLEQAVDIGNTHLGQEHWDTLACMDTLALVLRNNQEYDRAEQIYRHLLDVHRRRVGTIHEDVAAAMYNLGVTLFAQKKHDSAAEFLEQALQTALTIYGEDHIMTALAYASLGEVCLRKNQPENAETCLKRAVDIHEKILGKDHLQTRRYQQMLNQIAATAKSETPSATRHIGQEISLSDINIPKDVSPMEAMLLHGEKACDLIQKKQYTPASIALVRQEGLCRKIGDYEMLITNAILQSLLAYYKMKDPVGAALKMREALELQRRVGGISKTTDTAMMLKTLEKGDDPRLVKATEIPIFILVAAGGLYLYRFNPWWLVVGIPVACGALWGTINAVSNTVYPLRKPMSDLRYLCFERRMTRSD